MKVILKGKEIGKISLFKLSPNKYYKKIYTINNDKSYICNLPISGKFKIKDIKVTENGF